MQTGFVKKVFADRGFAFLEQEKGPDVFLHVKNCDPRLPFDDTLMGCRVTFDLVETEKGPKAVNVKAAA